MKKFWVRPDGNDEEEDARFDLRMKILKIMLIVLTMFLIGVRKQTIIGGKKHCEMLT
jgi:hypothetical protein